jgi:EAL domain-containing protein (putative c-di-GMP-specific phosphodiesterase class I)
MSSSFSETSGAPAVRDELPALGLQLEQIERYLASDGKIGMLSVTLLGQGEGDTDGAWAHYQTILDEISTFLPEFSRRALRRSDRLLEPVISGNSFVVLLTPPRDERSFNRTDLASVRNRLLRELNRHLSRTMPRPALERFQAYVGASLVRHDSGIDGRRIIYRGVEEAIADAMLQREREERRRNIYLRRILRGGQVHAVYQPVVDLVERRVIGYEALTRLQRAEFRSPDQLFRVAHESGALWTLERLCRKRALETLPPFEDDQLLFLNIEPDSMFDPQLRDAAFLQQMNHAGLAPDRIVLEVTEHAAVRDFASFKRVMKEIRALGFRLAMDDVGSGYAGLQSIAEIRPDYLKIDMSLVRDLHLNAIKRELITTIHRFSESTGIAIVAEGVESEAEMISLTDTGVRCAQGFLFAEPDSPPRAPDWARLEDVAPSDEDEA